MDGKITREDCVNLLRDMYEVKLEKSRYPKKSDFSDREVCAIKACFGPWPRALEACGVKPVRDDGRKEKNLEKRIRAKRRRTALRKNNPVVKKATEDS